MDWDALDAAFRASLATQPLGDGARAYAKARFDRPSVFARTCPHVVDALRREADGCRDGHKLDRARELYGDVLARDPHDWAARYGLGIIELRHGDVGAGQRALEALEGAEAVPRTWSDRAEEAIADASLGSDDPAAWPEARRRYEALAARSAEEDWARTIEVKGYAAAHADEGAREALVALLVGTRGRAVDGDEGLARVAGWARAMHDPVAEYVLGKNLANHEFWTEAGEHLDAALTGEVPTARIARELFKQRIIAACAIGDVAKAREVEARALAADGAFASSQGRAAWLRSFVDRCSK